MPETSPVQSSINNLSKAEWRSTISEWYTSMAGHPHPRPSSWEQLPKFPWNILPLFAAMCDTALAAELGPKQASGDGLRSIRLSARIPAGLPGKVLLSSSGWGSLASKLRMCSTSTATTKPEPGGAGREVLIPTERSRKQRFWWHCFVPGAQPRWRLSRITRLFSDISQ